LNYGECLKILKEYCINKRITNEILVNGPLEYFFEEAGISKLKGPNRGDIFHYEYTESSKIINNKQDISPQIRGALVKEGMEMVLWDSVRQFYDDYIDKNAAEDMVNCFYQNMKNDPSIENNELSQIKSLTNKPDVFLARVVARSLKEQNLKQNEKNAEVWSRGTGHIRIIKGDLLSYVMGRRLRKTRIVVIPVNTSFDTHVTVKAEREVKPIVSSNSLHGQLLFRLSVSGIKEETVKQRIINDLKTKGMIAEENKVVNLPIGTVATIEVGNAIVYLLAVSEFDENNNAHSSKEDIQEALLKMLDYYDRNGQGYDLFLPLVGTGLSRAGLDNQESLDLILKVFLNNTDRIHGGINIVVQPDIMNKISTEKGEKH